MKPIAIDPDGMAVIDLEREDGRAVAVQLDPPRVFDPINPHSIFARGGDWKDFPADVNVEPYLELVRGADLPTPEELAVAGAGA